ncbi:morphogenetic protein [Variovorax paradoxus]|uniref:Morphogenetic protein n=1 Tax=Variovorax paradoxus TaxID=34073 RepID=A0A6I6HJB5_VARPD|nr:morphogenetic protein [Variovorax paradoxus]QGW82961.1 morphogenetic protein [Variovorax paradoxus]
MSPPEFINTRRVPVSQFPHERPILFSASMVRALLDGSKTQTRRVVKPRRDRGIGCDLAPHEIAGEINGGDFTNAVYGAPGERLWVRESWQGPLIDSDLFEQHGGDMAPFRKPDYCRYAADGGPRPEYLDADDRLRQGWKPGIHMFRWASRITLEITGVRIERLQYITEADALAEGTPGGHGTVPGYGYAATPVEHYRWLWESLNAAGRPVLPADPQAKRYCRVKAWLDKHPDTTSWAANPWVWVVEFRRLEK